MKEGSKLQETLEKAFQLVDSNKYISKNLDSVYQQSKEMNKKLSSSDMTQGDYMLAREGFDVEGYHRSLKKLNVELKSAYESQEPLIKTDLSGYLKHEHKMIILTGIEEAKKITTNEFYRHYNHIMERDFEAAKKGYIQSIEARKGKGEPRNPIYAEVPEYPQMFYHKTGREATMANQRAEMYRLGDQNSINTGYNIPTNGERSKHPKHIGEYIKIINEYNKPKNESSMKLIEEFENCAHSTYENHDTRKREVIECWNILRTMLDENKNYAKKKLFKNQAADGSYEEYFLERAIGYLQNQYYRHIINISQKTGVQAMTDDDLESAGPIGTIQNYVSNMLFIQAQNRWQHGLLLKNNEPVWAILFYMIRCGKLSDAIKYAKPYLHSCIAPEVIQYLEAKLKKQDVSKFRAKFAQDYRQLKAKAVSSTDYVDIYKKAIYMIFSQSDVNSNIDSIFSTIEDYMWLKLVTVAPNSNYTLASLQNMVVNECGPHHFCPPGKTTLLYFKLLLLIQKFEMAIDYLMSDHMKPFKLEGIHYAIALHEYGVLREPSAEVVNNQPLLASLQVGNTKLDHLNFVYLIREYVRGFAHVYPEDAIAYYCLLDTGFQREYIQRLVVETRDHHLLLGQFENNRYTPGMLEKLGFKPSEIFTIMMNASRDYDKHSLIDKALNLLFLARRYNEINQLNSKQTIDTNILNIMNRELSQLQVLELPQQRELLHMADRIQQDKQAFEPTPVYHRFEKLIQLINFFQIHGRDPVQALSIMRSLQIVPFNNNDVKPCVDRYYHELSENIRRRVSEILQATISCLERTTNRISKGEMRAIVSSLCNFANQINSYLQPHIHRQLIDMQQRLLHR